MEGLTDVHACQKKWESALAVAEEAVKMAFKLGTKERAAKTLFSQGVIAANIKSIR